MAENELTLRIKRLFGRTRAVLRPRVLAEPVRRPEFLEPDDDKTRFDQTYETERKVNGALLRVLDPIERYGHVASLGGGIVVLIGVGLFANYTLRSGAPITHSSLTHSAPVAKGGAGESPNSVNRNALTSEGGLPSRAPASVETSNRVSISADERNLSAAERQEIIDADAQCERDLAAIRARDEARRKLPLPQFIAGMTETEIAAAVVERTRSNSKEVRDQIEQGLRNSDTWSDSIRALTAWVRANPSEEIRRLLESEIRAASNLPEAKANDPAIEEARQLVSPKRNEPE